MALRPEISGPGKQRAPGTEVTEGPVTRSAVSGMAIERRLGRATFAMVQHVLHVVSSECVTPGAGELAALADPDREAPLRGRVPAALSSRTVVGVDQDRRRQARQPEAIPARPQETMIKRDHSTGSRDRHPREKSRPVPDRR